MYVVVVPASPRHFKTAFPYLHDTGESDVKYLIGTFELAQPNRNRTTPRIRKLRADIVSCDDEIGQPSWLLLPAGFNKNQLLYTANMISVFLLVLRGPLQGLLLVTLPLPVYFLFIERSNVSYAIAVDGFKEGGREEKEEKSQEKKQKKRKEDVPFLYLFSFFLFYTYHFH